LAVHSSRTLNFPLILPRFHDFIHNACLICPFDSAKQLFDEMPSSIVSPTVTRLFFFLGSTSEKWFDLASGF
jgi:hypothetical protein